MARQSRGRLFSPHGRGGVSPLQRKVIIGCISAAVFLIIALIIGYYQLLAYLQGDSFRKQAESGLKSASGAAAVEMSSNFRIDGSRVSSESIRIEKLGSISEARAARINADVNRSALFNRKLHLRKLSTEEATLVLNTAPQPARKKSSPRSSTKAPKTASSASALAALLPSAFELDLFECKDSDLVIKHSAGEYQLFGANLTATPAPRVGKDAWQFNIENARLRTPFYYLKDSSVKSATVVYHNKVFNLIDGRVLLTPGEMRTKGHYNLQQHNWTLDLQVNKGNVHRILSEDWKKRISGDLYGRMVITGKNGTITSGVGSVSLQNGVLEALPFLSQLPVGNTYPYRAIELEKADCQILFPYNQGKIKNAWVFDKINLKSKDSGLIVRGRILIGTDRKLGGTLTIGLPQNTLDSIPVSSELLVEKLFTAHGEEPGYLWVNMNLSGTIDHPEEDLSIRIATLVGQSLSSFLTEIPKASASSLFALLLKQKNKPEETEQETTETPEEKGIDPLQDAADAASSILKILF